MAPPAFLEGVIQDMDGSHQRDEIFVPQCSKTDLEVHALHILARRGTLPADAAERQLNTYLLAARLEFVQPRSLILPLSDAPQPGTMPDLGNVIHRVMARDPIPCCLSAVMEQCIPPLRHTSRLIPYTDSQDVLINIVTGMLLGLYQDNTKKPGFPMRAKLYAQCHRMLTASKEAQTQFCRCNEEVIMLACMEYMARVVPLHMPVQAKVLTHKDASTCGFYRRIPVLCDELRQTLDESPEPNELPWPTIRALCAEKVTRVSRLKRVATLSSQRDTVPWNTSPANTLLTNVRQYLEIPRLFSSTADEFSLLCSGLNLQPSLLQQIQSEIQIHVLPDNLRDMQLDALQHMAVTSKRKAYLRAHRHICVHCLLTQSSRASFLATLRLDTLMQQLVCATCLTHDIVAINLLGRVLSLRGQQFYLCPQCVTVQQYKGVGEQIWASHQCSPMDGCSGTHCTHKTPEQKNGSKRKPLCFWCMEPVATQTVERVDHITGEMLEFHYCQRHAPSYEAVFKCSNAKQLAALTPHPQKKSHSGEAQSGI